MTGGIIVKIETFKYIRASRAREHVGESWRMQLIGLKVIG